MLFVDTSSRHKAFLRGSIHLILDVHVDPFGIGNNFVFVFFVGLQKHLRDISGSVAPECYTLFCLLLRAGRYLQSVLTAGNDADSKFPSLKAKQ